MIAALAFGQAERTMFYGLKAIFYGPMLLEVPGPRVRPWDKQKEPSFMALRPSFMALRPLFATSDASQNSLGAHARVGGSSGPPAPPPPPSSLQSKSVILFYF